MTRTYMLLALVCAVWFILTVCDITQEREDG